MDAIIVKANRDGESPLPVSDRLVYKSSREAKYRGSNGLSLARESKNTAIYMNIKAQRVYRTNRLSRVYRNNMLYQSQWIEQACISERARSWKNKASRSSQLESLYGSSSVYAVLMVLDYWGIYNNKENGVSLTGLLTYRPEEVLVRHNTENATDEPISFYSVARYWELSKILDLLGR